MFLDFLHIFLQDWWITIPEPLLISPQMDKHYPQMIQVYGIGFTLQNIQDGNEKSAMHHWCIHSRACTTWLFNIAVENPL